MKKVISALVLSAFFSTMANAQTPATPTPLPPTVSTVAPPVAPVSPTAPVAPATTAKPATPTGQLGAASATAAAQNAKEVAKFGMVGNESRIQIALSKLPFEKAKLFNETMQKNLEKNKTNQETLRKIYSDIRTNFNATEFNKQDFLDKSKQARDMQLEIRANLDADLAEVASQFTQTERQLIFNALPARFTRDTEQF